MSIKTENIKIIAAGITSISPDWWLSQVNSAYAVNRIYYFFNPGVECNIVIDHKKIHKELVPGKLYFLPSNLTIKFEIKKEKISHVWFDFLVSDLTFEENIFELEVLANSYEKKLLDFILRYFTEHYTDSYVYYKLPDSSRLRIPYNVAQTTLSLFLMLLDERYNIVSTTPTNLLKTIEYIHSHYDSNILLDDLCGIAHLSESQLVRKFNEVFNTPPHKYIMNFKMYMSACMLNEGNSVTNTALALGYSSVNAFSNAFKKHFGFSPKGLKQNN